MQNHTIMGKRTYLLVFLLSLVICFSGGVLKAQLSFKVLFLGNSYTGVNNLPQLVHDVALSAGDTLIFDSNTPGGYRLVDHMNDLTSQGKIMAGGWDYVVLQGQSQEPVTNSGQFLGSGYALNVMIKQYNSCAVTLPYMTWGRKFGDASNCANFPVMCTYESMDSALRHQYLNLATSLNGEVSPVSVVWRYLRQNYPGIDLYQADESHPSSEGSYAAACTFYATIFKKDPTLISYDFGLNAVDASVIRSAVKSQVFDSLQIWDLRRMPVSDFRYRIGAGVNEVILEPVNQGVSQTYYWDFGDGTTSVLPNSSHLYMNNGTYTISLTTTTCDLQGIHSSYSDTIIQFCNHTPTIFTSMPWLCNHDTLWTQAADSYQWYLYGIPLPETNQYLSNYYQYNSFSGFSVLVTDSGCAELSQEFSENPVWSGYYFDALGDPCMGDTVQFAVLHINGFLSGLESIYWYKNDTLLSSFTNEDTLSITASGLYKCQVINPGSNCPLDTTTYSIEYTCGVAGLVTEDGKMSWTLFPNPSSEFIYIKFSQCPCKKQMEIYNANGRLEKSISTSNETTEVDISGLGNGLYYIRLREKELPALKFVKR